MFRVLAISLSVLALAPTIAALAQAPPAGVKANESLSTTEWVKRFLELSERAVVVREPIQVLEPFADAGGKLDPVAMANALRPALARTMKNLAGFEAELETLASAQRAQEDPEISRKLSLLIQDMRTQLRNARAAATSLQNVVAAIDRRDPDGFARHMRAAAVGYSNLLHGDVAALKARQLMMKPTEGDYQRIETQIAFYEVSLLLHDGDSANDAEGLKALAARVRAAEVAGRAAAVEERKGLSRYRSPDRELLARTLDIEEQFFDISADLSRALEAARLDALSSLSSDELRAAYDARLDGFDQRFSAWSLALNASHKALVDHVPTP